MACNGERDPIEIDLLYRSVDNIPYDKVPQDNKFDFSYYKLFERKFFETIQLIDLHKLTKEIFFNTTDMSINTQILNRVLLKFLKEEKCEKLINWICVAFLTLGKTNVKDDLKHSYYIYRKFNIKLFVLEKIDNFSYKGISDIPDETNVNKNKKTFDSLSILFFLHYLFHQ